jgi:ferric-dicitrate binding protein FerR (iron transport regulator)
MNYLELILKHLKGEATEMEAEALEKWLEESEENQQVFEELKNTWISAEKIQRPVYFDKEQAWQSVQHKIKHAPLERAGGHKNYRGWLLRAAAVFIISLFGVWFFYTKQGDSKLLSVETAAEQKEILLSDGSRIFLNAYSRLDYPETFNQPVRQVHLEGEAFFEVAKDSLHPFAVGNNDFDVEVLGTSFNISAYAQHEVAVLTVVTGKVNFADKDGNSVLLVKDESCVFNRARETLQKSENNNLNFLAWKTKTLTFKDTPFKEVVEALQQYFLIEIEVRDAPILNCRYTGTFNKPDLNEVLQVLEKTLEIKAELTNKKVVLSGKGCE